MDEYPRARWSVTTGSVGASFWTRAVPLDGGGGYYLYTWERGSLVIKLEELVQSNYKPGEKYGEPSVYAPIDTIPVPEEIREQNETGRELFVAQLIHADMVGRFPPVAHWLTYHGSGKVTWFHEQVVNGQ